MSLFKSIIRTTIFIGATLLLTSCSDYKLLKIEQTTVKPIKQSDDRYDDDYGVPVKTNSENNHTTAPQYRKKATFKLKQNAPTRYRVQKGDTLWDISNKFLKNPWFWPEIWDKNQKITNPHLIYPNDLLTIYQTRRQVKQDGRIVEILSPRIRVERTGSGAGKPLSTLTPFLAWPRVLDKDTIAHAPYIVDGQNQHLLIENNQTVYIKKLRDRRIGQRYPVFRKNKPLYDPVTRELLGYEVIYAADAQITRHSNGIASATILNSKREVHKGDRLLKNIDEKVILNAPMKAPQHKVRASVLSLYEAHLISGTGMIITLNAGSTKGMQAGHIIGVYKAGKIVNDPYETREITEYKYLKKNTPVKVPLPPERIATAVVYKVTKKLSYALITQSNHTVKKGYKIGNP